MTREIKFICPKCKTENEPDKKRSNENWKVVNANCDKCGIKMELKIIKK
jgi:transcription elongation factor Elf1